MVEGHRSWLERPVARICDLLLVPSPGQAWLADRLDEATRQLKVELAARREAEAELEVLRSSAAWVWDMVLGGVGRPSSLVTSMSVVVDLLGGRIDAVAANWVRWGSCSALVAAMSHFTELDFDLEVLGSGCTAGLTDDEVDALFGCL
jgi:hypothetical protein